MYIVMLIKSYDWGILGEELPTNGIKIRVRVFRKMFRCSNYKKWEFLQNGRVETDKENSNIGQT